MKIISFAWTTDALLAGAKTCTRREWSAGYARRFKKGELVQAWDKGPRMGGKQVAIIRLTKAPYREYMADAPEADFEAEGLKWMAERGLSLPNHCTPYVLWATWKAMNTRLWVIRFEVVKQ